MSDFEVLIPKLGESIQEATVTKLFVKVGDSVKEDDLLFEVATDKVDSEIPSPVAGTIKAILCKVDDLLAVGKVAMVIDLQGKSAEGPAVVVEEPVAEQTVVVKEPLAETDIVREKSVSTRFYSPLVKNKKMILRKGLKIFSSCWFPLEGFCDLSQSVGGNMI